LEKTIVLASLLAAIFTVSSIQAQNSTLPELGDGATRFLSPKQEHEVGLAFLRQLLSDSTYVDDHQLQHYLQSVGDHIGQYAELHGTKLTFYLIVSNDINAFTVPGGHIAFNTGLLLSIEEESELASVIGHEIAHLSQRHLPRLLAQAQDQKIPATTAAMIIAVLLGGQAGLAGLTVTNATLLSNQLSYTRDFEQEADLMGIRLLAESGFDPSAMGRFFGKLERYTRVESNNVHEFLRTHPLSYKRIAASESRAKEFPPIHHKSSLEFYLMQARIRAIYIQRKTNSLEYFNEQRSQSIGNKKVAAIYGLAIMLTKERCYDDAELLLSPLLKKYPDIPYFQILQAQIDQANKKPKKAVDRLQTLSTSNPQLEIVTYYLAEALLANNQPEEAKRIIRYQIRRHPNRYKLYPLLTKANIAMGLVAEAHQSDAEYYTAIGAYKKAIRALKLALRDNKTTEGYFSQSIKARIKQLKELHSFSKQNQLH